jgi:hypothetical protein
MTQIFSADKTIHRLIRNEPRPSCTATMNTLRRLMDAIVDAEAETEKGKRGKVIKNKEALKELACLAKAYHTVRYLRNCCRLP